MADDPLPSVRVLGLRLTALDRQATLAAIATAARQRVPGMTTVSFVNVFCWTEARRDPSYAAALAGTDLVLGDGLPLRWASRWLGTPIPERVTGPDAFIAGNARAAREGLSVFVLTFNEGAAEAAAAGLTASNPGLQIAGTLSVPFGPLTDELTDDIVAEVNRVRPDLLWIGFGAPRQERWLHANRHRLDAGVALTVGSALDYATGRARRAPAWVQRAGLEWAYRVMQHPPLFRRKRYYAYPWEFFLPVVIESARRRLRRRRGPVSTTP